MTEAPKSLKERLEELKRQKSATMNTTATRQSRPQQESASGINAVIDRITAATPLPDAAPAPAVKLKYRHGPAPRCSSAAFAKKFIQKKRARDASCEKARRSHEPLQIDVEGAPRRHSRSVNSYELVRRVAEGVYGIVYEGKDVVTGDRRALKLIKKEWFLESQVGFPVYLLREFDLVMRLNHPNIVHGLELAHCRSSTDGSTMIFLVTEFAPRDLKDIIYSRYLHVSSSLGIGSPAYAAATRSLVARAKCILQQLLRGVGFLHRCGVIHRDMKASNILVSVDGVLKIADFGLARIFRDGEHLSPNVVTLLYRAPELHFGISDYGGSVDVWSVACIFAEVLRKTPLFKGNDETVHFQSICDALGAPTDEAFQGFLHLPEALRLVRALGPNVNMRCTLRDADGKFGGERGNLLLSDLGYDLLLKMLTWNPMHRISAAEALQHPYFTENPLPCEPKELWVPLYTPPPRRAPAAIRPDAEVRAPSKSPPPGEKSAESPNIARPAKSPSARDAHRNLCNLLDTAEEGDALQQSLLQQQQQQQGVALEKAERTNDAEASSSSSTSSSSSSSDVDDDDADPNHQKRSH